LPQRRTGSMKNVMQACMIEGILYWKLFVMFLCFPRANDGVVT